MTLVLLERSADYALQNLAQVTAAGAAQGGAIELAAHGWDIAAACGLDHGIPQVHAGQLLVLAESLVDDDARRAFFGPAVDLPATAPPSARFRRLPGQGPRRHSTLVMS